MDSKKGNKIFAISGEPVSGKGTAVKELKKKFLEQGYQDDKIHVISTGTEFRMYFEKIIDFLNNADNEEYLKKLAEDRQIKGILENKEYRQALVSLMTRLKEQKVDIEQIDLAYINSSEEFSEIRKIVDFLIDSHIEEIGMEINKEEKPDEVWIFDSRMAFHNVPNAFSIRLTTNSKVAGQRLFNDTTREKQDTYKSVEEAEKAREERRIAEIERYKKIYGVDVEDKENYDLVIDTSYSSVEDIVNTMLECEKCKREDRPFGKTWASPLTMLPCQKIGETWETQWGSSWTLEQLSDDILEKGYFPEEEIKIYKIDGINYILEGHHRNFASIMAGKTLIPYIDLAQTEQGKEKIKKGAIPTCRQNDLFDHEALVEKALIKTSGDDTLVFSYSRIYPGILEKIKQKEGTSR